MNTKIKLPKTKLNENEELIRRSGGGPIKFITGAKGGHLYLTNQRIIHENHVKRKTLEIPISNIADVTIGHYSMLLMILPILKCLKVYLKDGSHYKLNVADKKGWSVSILAAK